MGKSLIKLLFKKSKNLSLDFKFFLNIFSFFFLFIKFKLSIKAMSLNKILYVDGIIKFFIEILKNSFFGKLKDSKIILLNLNANFETINS